MTAMEDLTPWYKARDSIFSSIEDDLMGPAGPVPFSEPPLSRVIVGVLYPRAEAADSDDSYRSFLEEDEAQGSEAGSSSTDNGVEATVSMSHSAKPSSMGLTFTVNPATTPIVSIVAGARRYTPTDNIWQATDALTPDNLVISTSVPERLDRLVSINESSLRLVGVVRAELDGLVRITMSLVNRNSMSEISGYVDEHCWFRPFITVTTPEGCFVDRRQSRSVPIADEDVRSTDFLYRNEPALGIGHGCAVEWDDTPNPVIALNTTYIPTHDVKLASPAGGDSDDQFGAYDLRMDVLASSTDHSQMTAMVDAYERWIAARSFEAENLHEPHRSVALEHMGFATNCATRIREGIQTLGDPDIGRAFQLMNEAMVEQRNAQDNARKTTLGTQRWRPFQLAFILMNLPGLSDPQNPDRDTVDLLWFPTGGGKTEAYLGCIGLAILLRRIRRSCDGGVSAIMRYTLRLLTRQQFERASGLICALELIRRREMPTTIPISLGLWVGNSATPNKIDDARSILNKIAMGDEPEGSTPMQLLRCPWCGNKLSHVNYVVEKDSLTIKCRESACPFRDGLPLYVVDSDIYRVRPSLLIGTVDKFALMTWRSQIGSLLSVDGPDTRPDLIVQDELHLISGPLGTMVGLYESALDLACTGQGRPKVLASTATIRRAEQQVRAIFDRDAVQFPPPGLDPSDNYFAVEAPAASKGTRKYVGIMAPGTSQATLIVRIYSVLLQSVFELDADDKVKDNYWTLLGYFNSLRVLGSTYLQVLDDIPDRVGVVAARHGVEPRSISQDPVELTSRVDQTKIPRAMESLETSFPAPDSPDVVLATNMISVGLDIDRLGLMVVAGQPQNTSEYVQSTSRVGRRHPGLVLVALNAQRSRDSSHYESFIPFHRALYRDVEATTATPFASRARDRGAHGMLVAAIRLLIKELRQDDSVISVANFRPSVDKVIESLVARANRVAPDESAAFADQLRTLVDTWQDEVSRESVREYGVLKHPKNRSKRIAYPLLATAGADPATPATYPVRRPPWPTLSSMRDVDAETHLYVRNLAREAQPDGTE